MALRIGWGHIVRRFWDGTTSRTCRNAKDGVRGLPSSCVASRGLTKPRGCAYRDHGESDHFVDRSSQARILGPV